MFAWSVVSFKKSFFYKKCYLATRPPIFNKLIVTGIVRGLGSQLGPLAESPRSATVEVNCWRTAEGWGDLGDILSQMKDWGSGNAFRRSPANLVVTRRLTPMSTSHWPLHGEYTEAGVM